MEFAVPSGRFLVRLVSESRSSGVCLLSAEPRVMVTLTADAAEPTRCGDAVVHIVLGGSGW